MNSFAERLTHLRESKNLKQKELASILNVSPACISQYESARTMPSHETLLQIAQYFNVSVDFLVAGSSSKLPFNLTDKFYNDTTYLSLLQECHRIPPKDRPAFLRVLIALQDNPCE